MHTSDQRISSVVGPQGASTIPALLTARAQVAGQHVALQYKQRGAWYSVSWANVQDDVEGLARGLLRRGFQDGFRLVVIGPPGYRQLILGLAALSLGGSIAPFDDDVDLEALALDASTFALASDSEQLSRIRAADRHGLLHTTIVDDRRSRAPSTSEREVGYSALVELEAGAPLASAENRIRAVSERQTAFEYATRRLSHAQVVEAARAATAELELGPTQRCLWWQSLTSKEVAVVALASWLVSGFEVLLPEEAGSVELDGGERGATYRFGTADDWERWVDAVQSRLAPDKTLRRRFVEWALGVGAAPERHSAPARWVSRMLVLAPLRRVLGIEPLTRVLSLNQGPSDRARRFLDAVGLRLSVADVLPTPAIRLHAADIDAAPSPVLAQQSA